MKILLVLSLFGFLSVNSAEAKVTKSAVDTIIVKGGPAAPGHTIGRLNHKWGNNPGSEGPCPLDSSGHIASGCTEYYSND